MKVGLFNLEPKIENTAMMKVSMYHKKRGDVIEEYFPLFHKSYDKIYCFSLFTWTKKPRKEFRKDMTCGGTGFDLKTRLPYEIDKLKEIDYSLYPDCDCSYIWFSRGCIRDCAFCCVREKEGYITSVEPYDLNPNGKYISVMDNNFFANPEWREAIKQLKKWNLPVDFQGVDIRLLDPEKCKLLNSIPLVNVAKIHIAWDFPKENLLPKIKEVLKYIKSYKFMCYVLIGFNSSEEEDMYRVERLRELKIDPFVMPYNKFDSYQRRFARWVNRKELFYSVTWENFNKGERK